MQLALVLFSRKMNEQKRLKNHHCGRTLQELNHELKRFEVHIHTYRNLLAFAFVALASGAPIIKFPFLDFSFR